jgi:hypothetical protein
MFAAGLVLHAIVAVLCTAGGSPTLDPKGEPLPAKREGSYKEISFFSDLLYPENSRPIWISAHLLGGWGGSNQEYTSRIKRINQGHEGHPGSYPMILSLDITQPENFKPKVFWEYLNSFIRNNRGEKQGSKIKVLAEDPENFQEDPLFQVFEREKS